MDETFYLALFDAIDNGIYFTDSTGCITFWNRAAAKISGYTREEVIGKRCSQAMLMHISAEGESMCGRDCPLLYAMKGTAVKDREMYLKHKQGHRVPIVVQVNPIRDSGGRVTGAVQVFRDISSRQALDQRMKSLERMALLDQVTGLATRGFIDRSIHARLDEMRRYAWQFGILFMDIDHFKKVNDTYGHDAGDRVLAMVSRTLLTNMRPFDLLGRWGGEELVAVIINPDEGYLFAIADRLRFLVSQSSVMSDSTVVKVTMSVGATLALPDDTGESLIKRADALLYESKDKGRNRVTIG